MACFSSHINQKSKTKFGFYHQTTQWTGSIFSREVNANRLSLVHNFNEAPSQSDCHLQNGHLLNWHCFGETDFLLCTAEVTLIS